MERKDVKQQIIQSFVIGLGNAYYKAGDYQQAINKYNELLDRYPNNVEAYNKRSTARSALGDYQGAMDDLLKATK